MGSRSEYLKTHGLVHTIKAVREIYVGAIFRRIFHRILQPTLFDFNNTFEGNFISNPELLFNNLLGISEMELKLIRAEFEASYKDLNNLKSKIKLNYPNNFGSEMNTLLILFAIVRSLKPSIIVETGVANGETTYILLSALNLNGYGRLYSYDISNDVGALVEETLKNRWTLQIIPKNSKKPFSQSLNKFDKIDLFIHDSSHTYKWQDFEYSVAFGKIRDGGILASDDVDMSYAFLDFVRKNNKFIKFAIFDKRKIFGLLKKENPLEVFGVKEAKNI